MNTEHKRASVGRLTICLIGFSLAASCGRPTIDDVLPTIDDLVDGERRAIVAVGDVPGTLAQATDVTRNSTDADTAALDESAGQEVPDVVVGTCPVVTTSGQLFEGDLEVTIDYGTEPCTTATSTEDAERACSGSATGTLNLTDALVTLGFDDLRCNERSIDGLVSLGYEIRASRLEFDGTWDLTATESDRTVRTAGEGRVVFEASPDACCNVTTVETFTGSISEGEDEWTAEMNGVLVSIEEYGSLIPFGGTITIDGPEIRSITVTFNENSPATGAITVTISGGPSFEVNLNDL